MLLKLITKLIGGVVSDVEVFRRQNMNFLEVGNISFPTCLLKNVCSSS